MVIVQMAGITKRFPGVVANDQVDIELHQGEIHGLLGENGAGKTTLMNILFGLYQPDAGQILIRGQPVTLHSPADAIRLGIGMVHQHFKLVGPFTVTENVILGLKGSALIDMKAAEREVAQVAEQYGMKIDPAARVQQLSVGEQQRVEVLSSLYRGAEVLILDEPTAVLTPQETESLAGGLKKMAEQGKSIVFISHKLEEVLRLTDRVTVLRDGRVVFNAMTCDTNKAQLAREMIGRNLAVLRSEQRARVMALAGAEEAPPMAVRGGDARLATPGQPADGQLVPSTCSGQAPVQPHGPAGEASPARPLTDGKVAPGGTGTVPSGAPWDASPLLEARDLYVADDRGLPAVRGVSLMVHGGEILGIAGVDGNGQRELAEAIVRLRHLQAGELTVEGEEASTWDTHAFLERRTAYIPDDRQNDGLILSFDLSRNATLKLFERPPYSVHGFLNYRAIAGFTRQLLSAFDVRTPGPFVRAGALSGGNQQKLILARELSQTPHLIIANKPTRGLDIGAAAYVHQKLLEQRDRGAGILLISADLDEIMLLSDRILVMFNGRSMGELEAHAADTQTLGLMMAGTPLSELKRQEPAP